MNASSTPRRLAWAALLALAGCASAPPPQFAANWYLVPAAPGAPASAAAFDMTLAIVNRGRQAETIETLQVNGQGDGHSGGYGIGRGDRAWTLQPGQLLLLALNQLFNGREGRPAWPLRCLLPVRLSLGLAGRDLPALPWRPARPATVILELEHPLPTALPEDWTSCPAPAATHSAH